MKGGRKGKGGRARGRKGGGRKEVEERKGGEDRKSREDKKGGREEVEAREDTGRQEGSEGGRKWEEGNVYRLTEETWAESSFVGRAPNC